MELIWQFFKGQYKVYCNRRDYAKTIGSWSGCVHDALYFYPDGHVEEDVVIPARQLKRVQLLIVKATQPENDEISPVAKQ